MCSGNTVPSEEQVDVKTAVLEGDQVKEGTPPGPGGLSMATSFVGLAGGGTSAISEAERQQLESEKMSLYQQLDDKVGVRIKGCCLCAHFANGFSFEFKVWCSRMTLSDFTY